MPPSLKACLLAVFLSAAAISSPTASASTGAQPVPSAPRAGMRPAADVLARISRDAGVIAVADSMVLRFRVPLPNAPTTPENVEQQLAEMVKALPEGTRWTKLYLPAPTSGRWNGDDLAAYALAQSRLFTVPGPTPVGMVEILGQRLPVERAREYITGLGLRGVYVVSNPKTQGLSAGSGSMAQMAQMTSEQIQQRATEIANMDPALRNQMMKQMVSVFAQAMGQMSPEQRQQMFQGTGLTVTPTGITIAPGGTGSP